MKTRKIEMMILLVLGLYACSANESHDCNVELNQKIYTFDSFSPAEVFPCLKYLVRNNNLRTIAFADPKSESEYKSINLPFDSIASIIRNSSIKSFSFISPQFHLEERHNNSNDSLENLFIFSSCIQIHENGLLAFPNLRELFLSSENAFSLDSTNFPKHLEKVSICCVTTDIPNHILSHPSIQNISLMGSDIDNIRLPEETVITARKVIINISQTKIGKALRKNESRAFQKLDSLYLRHPYLSFSF